MNIPLFNPFQPLAFKPHICFLSGKILNENPKQITAFPEWLMKRYQIEETTLSLLDGYRIKYKDMKLPVCDEVYDAITELDKVTQKAFEEGYETVKTMPELTLFQWMARVLYGILYHDFSYAINFHEKRDKEFEVSPLMQQRYRNLLFMLQSLIYPIEFKGFLPWSIKCYSVNISKDILNYKDETNKLNFCFGMNGFGIIACLQDNGQVAAFHHHLLEQINDAMLHPAQFEELYGHFIYANYLLSESPDYLITLENHKIVFQLPNNFKAQNFKVWDDKMFAQVLANLWQPWGITIKDIHQFPNSPISYLINERTNTFIKHQEVDLPF